MPSQKGGMQMDFAIGIIVSVRSNRLPPCEPLASMTIRHVLVEIDFEGDRLHRLLHQRIGVSRIAP